MSCLVSTAGVTARRHASAVYAVVMCLFVCLSVTRRCSTETTKSCDHNKQRHTVAQTLYFSDAEDLGKTQTGSPPMEAPTAGGVG